MTPPPPAAPAGEPGEPEPPEAKLGIGKRNDGVFQPGLLVQIWFVVDHQDQDDPEESDWRTFFRARRAELRVKGEIIPRLVGYNVMIDAAKLLRFSETDVPVDNQQPPPADPSQQETVSVFEPPSDTSVLQDVFVTAMSEYVDVSFGQFKNLVSWEGYNSSSKLILPERALSSRTFGDRRDLGIKGEKKFAQFGYAVGLFSGEGLNQADSNNQKDLVVRAEVYPIENTLIGGLVYYALGERDEPNTRDRVEGDLRVDLANVLFQAEYIRGWQMDSEGTTRVEGHGAYGALGYTFIDHIQPVVRVGFIDPDLDADDNGTIGYELGVNYFVKTGEAKDEMKLQLSYSLFDNAQNYQQTGGENLTEVILNAQVAF